MSLSAESIVAMLERRYDHHSARVMFRQVAQRAGLAEGGPFGGPEVERLVAALKEVGDRLGALPEQLLAAGGRGGAVPAAKAPEAQKPSPEKAETKAPGAPTGAKAPDEKPAAEKPAAEKPVSDKAGPEKPVGDKGAEDKAEAAEGRPAADDGRGKKRG